MVAGIAAGTTEGIAEVVQIETPTLGDRSYLAHDHHVAVVIDPQRDIDRVLALADRLGVRITHVAETHIHNDYLTGGLALAQATGAEYLVNARDPVRFRRTGVADGDRVGVGGELELRVLATPGHTFTHLSYVLMAGGEVTGVFTGGSLLYGATGRPDLLGAQHTAALTRAQYASARRLARDLPDRTEVFPTHGFGSFCAAGTAGGRCSTIGKEKLVNSALTGGEQEFARAVLAGLDAWPAYYAHMGPANLSGPGLPDLSPPRRADPAELARRIKAGEWVIDLRDRAAFAAGFLPGSVSFPLDGSFATYLGWTVPWGSPVTLLGETPEQVARAQRELARIGFDRLAAASGPATAWANGHPLASLRLASFTDLANSLADHPAATPLSTTSLTATHTSPAPPAIRTSPAPLNAATPAPATPTAGSAEARVATPASPPAEPGNSAAPAAALPTTPGAAPPATSADSAPAASQSPVNTATPPVTPSAAPRVATPTSAAAVPITVLDVRRRLEWREGHIAGAVHIPLSELTDRLADVPPGELWVHCQSGYRAQVAASLLAARGRQVVAVDDDFEKARVAGLTLERG